MRAGTSTARSYRAEAGRPRTARPAIRAGPSSKRRLWPGTIVRAAAFQIRCGTRAAADCRGSRGLTQPSGGYAMNNIIYIVGLVVVVLAILSFLGLR